MFIHLSKNQIRSIKNKWKRFATFWCRVFSMRLENIFPNNSFFCRVWWVSPSSWHDTRQNGQKKVEYQKSVSPHANVFWEKTINFFKKTTWSCFLFVSLSEIFDGEDAMKEMVSPRAECKNKDGLMTSLEWALKYASSDCPTMSVRSLKMSMLSRSNDASFDST